MDRLEEGGTFPRPLFGIPSSRSASGRDSVPSLGPFLAVAVGCPRRSISRRSLHRTSQAPAFSTRVSEATLCLLGQSNKAIGHESPIGPCVATHPVDNRQACCFRKRSAPSRQRNGTTGERKRISAAHAETKQDTRPEEDHSGSRRAAQTVGLNTATTMGRY